MTYILKTLNNLENITIKETNNKAKKIFPQTLEIEKLPKLRTITTSYKLIKKFKFKEIQDILKELPKIKDFNIICKIKDNKLKSQELRNQIIAFICKKYKTKPNYKKPEQILYLDIIKHNCLLGINPKIELCKRNYKIRTSNNSLNACLASSLLILAKYNPKNSLLDPFCSDGIIVIEAALKKGKDIYATDPKSTNLFNAQLNSEVAKVKINFQLKQADQIITQLPFVSKRSNPKIIEKQLKNFLELTKKAKKITVITQKTNLLEKLTQDYNLKINLKKELLHGQTNYKIITFHKKS